MKLYNLVAFNTFYKNIANTEMPISLSYKLNNIINHYEKDLLFYQDELQKILNECVELDENNNFKMTEDNENFILKRDKIEYFEKKFNELQDIEIDFNNEDQISIDEFQNIKITPKQLLTIQSFIK